MFKIRLDQRSIGVQKLRVLDRTQLTEMAFISPERREDFRKIGDCFTHVDTPPDHSRGIIIF